MRQNASSRRGRCGPSAANVETLVRELANPKFKEYHLFFSNVLARDMLRNIAEADEHEVVKQVHEFYGDYIAVNEDLFTLNIDKSLLLSGPAGNSLETNSMFSQSVHGILAMLLSMKVEPSQIRYQGRSQVRAYAGPGSFLTDLCLEI